MTESDEDFERMKQFVIAEFHVGRRVFNRITGGRGSIAEWPSYLSAMDSHFSVKWDHLDEVLIVSIESLGLLFDDKPHAHTAQRFEVTTAEWTALQWAGMERVDGEPSLAQLNDILAKRPAPEQIAPGLSVRMAARDRCKLDGADAQALEHAITMTERERDEACAQLTRCNTACDEAKRKADDHRRMYEASQVEVERLKAELAALRGSLSLACEWLGYHVDHLVGLGQHKAADQVREVIGRVQAGQPDAIEPPPMQTVARTTKAAHAETAKDANYASLADELGRVTMALKCLAMARTSDEPSEMENDALRILSGERCKTMLGRGLQDQANGNKPGTVP